MRFLLRSSGINEASIDWEGVFLTPLFVASLLRLEDQLPQLVAAGADPNVQCFYAGLVCSPLHGAAVRGDATVLEALLAAGGMASPRPPELYNIDLEDSTDSEVERETDFFRARCESIERRCARALRAASRKEFDKVPPDLSFTESLDPVSPREISEPESREGSLAPAESRKSRSTEAFDLGTDSHLHHPAVQSPRQEAKALLAEQNETFAFVLEASNDSVEDSSVQLRRAMRQRPRTPRRPQLVAAAAHPNAQCFYAGLGELGLGPQCAPPACGAAKTADFREVADCHGRIGMVLMRIPPGPTSGIVVSSNSEEGLMPLPNGSDEDDIDDPHSYRQVRSARIY
ncbi:unnamed protein product [Symbiodinium microadriaticum]|nr:unnamed protein product [Symbiodinium microadriaticum]